jgi:NAD dependent epimerase/dehydratase family enzyme
LLNGQRVIPERLQGAGFKFSYLELRSALASIYSD